MVGILIEKEECRSGAFVKDIGFGMEGVLKIQREHHSVQNGRRFAA